MSFNSSIKSLSTTLLGLFLFISAHAQKDQSISPNVVLFLVDDLGWADVGYQGSSFYNTPNIDAFAKDGVRFSNAYAASHVCSPSRASILTGKYPASINLTDWLPGRKNFPFQKLENVEINQHLPFDLTTIAEALQENGYRTAIYGKWHLGEDPSGPLNHGFDVQVPDWNKGWPLTYYAPFRLEGLPGKEGEYLTDELTTEALKFIKDNKDHPFFLYLSHFAVHDPIEGDPKLMGKYEEKLNEMKPAEIPFILEGDPDNEPHYTEKEKRKLLKDPAYKGHKILPDRMVKVKQRQDNVQFASMVESVDNSLGRVLSTLDSLKLSDNTIIIFYSDNGGMAAANFYDPTREIPLSKLDKAYSTSNLPLKGAKGWLYEGGIRVPLVIKWPGHESSKKVVSTPVIGPDIYPTIIDMAGLPEKYNEDVDGVSLVPLMQGKDIERKAIFWHFPHYSNHGMQSPGGAVRKGDYKLLDYFENGTVQLFNLKNDPGEHHDLSKEMPEKVNELQNLLNNWRKQVSAKMMKGNPDYKLNN